MAKGKQRKHEDPGIFLGTRLLQSDRVIGFCRQDSPIRGAEVFLHGESHLATIAKTGAGKGVSSIIPTLLTTPKSVVVVDPKAESLHVTARRRIDLGQIVQSLDPMHIGPKEFRASLNPLDLLKRDSKSLVEDATMLSEILTDSAFRPEDSFWSHRARQLIAGVMIGLVLCNDRTPPLSAVRAVLNSSQEELAQSGAAMVESSHPEIRAAGSILTNEAAVTVGGIISTAQNALTFLGGEMIDAATRETTLDIAALVQEKPISIFIAIPPEMQKSHAKLLKMWMAVIMNLLLRRRSCSKQKTLLLIDEAAQLGHFSQLLQAMTLLRGYGVQVWTLWQDLQQMSSCYPADWQTILNNCGALQILGPQALGASQSLANLVGEISPDRLRNLPRGNSFVTMPESCPVEVISPNYLTDPTYVGLYEANPFYNSKKKKRARGQD